MDKKLIALVGSLVLAFQVHAQEYTEVPSDASLITYNDAANCSEAQGIVIAAQGAANERIRDVNDTVRRIGTETRNRRACIENLMRLLTFSIPTFPSLTAIVNRLVQAFIQNLIGRACAAATSAINGAISQVNGQISGAQGAVNNITEPLINITKQAAGISAAVLPDPSRIVREEISTRMPSQAPVAPGQIPAPVQPIVVTPSMTPGSLAGTQGGAGNQPAQGQQDGQAKGGWSRVSCLIFGGC
jgi:hypothetical protein